MLDSIALFLADIAHRLHHFFLRRLNEKEYEVRKNFVRQFLYTYLPEKDPSFKGVAILEDVKPNYFHLSDGTFPIFSFIIPEKSLFVIVGRADLASWNLASLRGVSRSSWEKSMRDLAIIKEEVPKLKTIGWAKPSKLITLHWEDPISDQCLYEILIKEKHV